MLPDLAIFKKCQGCIFSVKLAQIDDDFLGSSEKNHSLVKTALTPFWATFGENWATIYARLLGTK